MITLITIDLMRQSLITSSLEYGGSTNIMSRHVAVMRVPLNVGATDLASSSVRMKSSDSGFREL